MRLLSVGTEVLTRDLSGQVGR